MMNLMAREPPPQFPLAYLSMMANDLPQRRVAEPEPQQHQQQHHHANHWRTLLDNCLIELIASLFLHLVTVLCWPGADNMRQMDVVLQFAPAVVLGLNLLCIKDEDYFFPDGAPTVTIVLWILGGYNWQHVAARMLGQGLGVGITIWITLAATDLSPLKHRTDHPSMVLFALELIGTLIEHLAVVYVLLPLLPPLSTSTSETVVRNTTTTPAKLMIRKVKLKAHPDTQPPSNSAVMHAAITFSVLHWCLWRGLSIEMSPTMTFVIATLHSAHHTKPIDLIWSTALVAMWGQLVGVCLCLLYAALYVPREIKFWPARHLKT
jgi:glycerol uptake facilitator-like aquaporin